MSIAFDLATPHNPAAGTSFTFAHTNTGPEIAILVGIVQFGAGLGGSDRVSSVTYGGITLSKLRAQVEVLNGARLQLMGGVGVPSGSQNVVVNMTTSTSVQIIAATYSGVKQSDPWQGANGVSAAQTAASVTLPITTDEINSWLAGFSWENASGTQTGGANTTVRVSQSSTVWLDSNGGYNPAGSYSLISDVTGTNPRLTIAGIGLQPSLSKRGAIAAFF